MNRERKFQEREEPTIKQYFKEVSRYPLLSKEEEKRLARMKKKGEELAEEKLICSNLRLVIKVAKRYLGRGLSLADLIEEGNLGLIEAVDRFDGREGNRFATYAVWWIRVAIQKALAKSGATKMPFYFNALIHKITKAERYLMVKHGFASISEIARIAELSEEEVAKIQRVRKIKKPISLNQEVNEEGKELIDFLADDKSKNFESDLIEEIDLREKLNWASSQFPVRTVKILWWRVGYDMENKKICRPKTYNEIGDKLNLTRGRIEQLYNGALRRMKTSKKFQFLKEVY